MYFVSVSVFLGVVLIIAYGLNQLQRGESVLTHWLFKSCLTNVGEAEFWGYGTSSEPTWSDTQSAALALVTACAFSSALVCAEEKFYPVPGFATPTRHKYGYYAVSSSGTLLVVFHGTETLENVMTDIRFRQTPFPPYGSVHEGFADQYVGSVRSDVLAFAAQHAASIKRVVVTGHSLGAALAQLCAVDLAARLPSVMLFTFASPRVGDEAFADAMDASVDHKRFQNVNDLIPAMPGGLSANSEYFHSGTPYLLSVETGTIANDHGLKAYRTAIAQNKFISIP